MSITPWLPTVRKIKDGETVDQSTVNVPIDQLTQREQHLYEKFEELSGKSVLISFGQPIHPNEQLSVGELSIVYFTSDENGEGLKKGTTGFSSSSSSSMFSPNNSNYSFGLLKTIYSETNTADVYTEGLCELPIDLDHPTLGLIETVNGSTEEFRVGPYYLSAKTKGKITKDPSGVPVYVGYAISKRKILIHTNVDEFSQFFINYRYHVLDRVAGTPELNDGVWSITNEDGAKLGWFPADKLDASTAVPTGAVFYYNIPPSTYLTVPTLEEYDVALEDYEREEAVELKKYIPPVPANFIQLYVNGSLARYNNYYDTEGTFSVNEYGLWWHSANDGEQPWSDDYPQTGSPVGWLSTIAAAIENSRKRIFVSFSKFNPALRTQLVSSIKAFNTANNKAGNFIKFYSGDNVAETAKTGDLIVDIDAQFSNVGHSNNSSFVYPPAVNASFTADRAIAAIKYSKEEGLFKVAVTTVVAKLTGSNGLSVTDQGAGVWNIEYAGQGSTGQVDSIEPVNSRLEFKGLFSYIKLPTPSTTPYGLIGKIVLPRGATNNKTLRLAFHLFGDTTIENASIARKIAFQFEYSAATARNSANPSSYNLVSSPTYTPTTNPVEFSLIDSGAYAANTAIKLVHADISVPAQFVREDSVINFKIMRVSVGTANQSYPGNVGLLATYWEIPNI